MELLKQLSDNLIKPKIFVYLYTHFNPKRFFVISI